MSMTEHARYMKDAHIQPKKWRRPATPVHVRNRLMPGSAHKRYVPMEKSVANSSTRLSLGGAFTICGMLGTGHSHTKTSPCHGMALDSAPLSSAMTITELDVLQISEAEYTQLQILDSDMDPQSSEGSMESGVDFAFHPGCSSSGIPHYQSGFSSSGCPSLYFTFCHQPLMESADDNLMNLNQSLGHLDFQEMRMMMLNDVNIPCCSDTADKSPIEAGSVSSGAEAATPSFSSCGCPSLCAAFCHQPLMESTDDNLMNLNQSLGHLDFQEMRMMMLNNDNIPCCSDTADKSPKDSSGAGTVMKNQDGSATGKEEMVKLMKVPKRKSAVCVRLEERFTVIKSEGPKKKRDAQDPMTRVKPMWAAGSPGPLLEAGQHQETDLSRSFPFRYQQKPDPVWVNCNELTTSQTIQPSAGSARGPTVQLLTKLWKAVRRQQTSQSRERHNLLERHRRARIRASCDELNLLVPFCDPGTDKATTLQRTTNFLRYIQQLHGDILKKEFENAFCGRKGEISKGFKMETPDAAD